MSNEQWEKLISLPEEYEPTPELAQKAIQELTNRPVPVKRSWWKKHWKPIAACATSLVLAIGIAIPVYHYLSATPAPIYVYYDNNDLVYENLTDVDAFIQEKILPVHCFSLPGTVTKAAIVEATQEVAFLTQSMVNFDSSNFDEVNLQIVLMHNVDLDFQKTYSSLSDSSLISNINVSYDTNAINGVRKVLAKFSYEGADYYLEVTTEREALECVNAYMGMLFD